MIWRKINQLTKDDLELDLKLNTNKSIDKLNSFKKYDALKTYVEKGLDLKRCNQFDKTFKI